MSRTFWWWVATVLITALFLAVGWLIYNDLKLREAAKEQEPHDCIAADSNIFTPMGTRRADQIRVGDEVFSVNVGSRELVVSTVIRVTASERPVGQIHVGGEILRVTNEHPLFDPASNSFHPAQEWFAGSRRMLLSQSENGIRVVTVSRVVRPSDSSPVIDFSVGGAHKNFLADSILVHNKTVF